MAMDEMLLDRQHRLFNAMSGLAPLPPDTAQVVAKIARVGSSMLPNLCNDAQQLRFSQAVSVELAYHMASLRSYVERQNYCSTLLAYLSGPGRVQAQSVLKNFAT